MNSLEQRLHKLKNISLSADSKNRIREELLAYTDLHTVQKNHFFKESRFTGFTLRLYTSFAILLVIVVGVGGTAYAAEGTLPGDLLYSIKVSVTEPIQTALVPDQKGRAAWHAILAERRLEEATRLAALNALTPKTQAALAANFDTHVKNSVEEANSLQSAGDTESALSVRSDLEARITAHGQILSLIATHFDTASTSLAQHDDEGLLSLIAVVHKNEQELSSSRHELEQSLALSASSSPQLALAKAKSTSSARVAKEKRNEPSSGDPVVASQEARTSEVQSILSRSAAFLAKFFPQASTTEATTTHATSTEPSQTATTTQSEEKIKELVPN